MKCVKCVALEAGLEEGISHNVRLADGSIARLCESCAKNRVLNAAVERYPVTSGRVIEYYGFQDVPLSVKV